MDNSRVEVRITHLKAQVAEGVVVEWQGHALTSGPLNIELDQTASSGNEGELDYGKHRAHADFRVLLAFPELASLLESLGVDPDLDWTKPVYAAIWAEGQILNDHGLSLNGRCDLGDHALLNPGETRAFILPGT
jgi:hypothetical protein